MEGVKMKKKDRIRLRKIDAKYGLPKGMTQQLKESGIIKSKEK